MSRMRNEGMRIRTIQKLSEHREVTPEGYLLCTGAALARTGVMRYLASEVEPEIMGGSRSDEALLYRDEKEVFDPQAIASFEGKPLTLDHPDEDVDPETWRELARGVVLNVRRGSGPEDDLLLADILITDAEAIEAVKKGLCELSCGYDTKMEPIRPGVGRQTQIRGNHVALVESGRAGARCRINDSEEKTMVKAKSKKKFMLLDGLKRLLRDAENAGADDEPQKDDEPETPQAATDNDLATIAAGIEEMKLMLRTLVEALKPAADEEPATDGETDEAADGESSESSQDEEACDEENGSQDEEGVADEEAGEPAKDRRPRALCDAKTAKLAQRLGLSGARVGDSADAARRGALAIAMRDAATAGLVKDILGVPLSRANAASVRAAFLAAAAVKGRDGNLRTADGLTRSGKAGSGPMTPARINQMNKKFYGGK